MDLEKFVAKLAREKNIAKLAREKNITKQSLEQEKRNFLKEEHEKQFIKSSTLLKVYHSLLEEGKIKRSTVLERALQLKAIRSLSGVSVVTVLTKPWPCPGKCVYCPALEDMPKSYIASEPAAQRAKQNKFDPYKQVTSRLMQYKNIGHPTNKIELIILGGSFNAYPKDYQEWFIKECFRASNSFVNPSGCQDYELEKQHKLNEKAKSRIVFLSVETRPDLITKKEALFFRKLGITKVELGVQSLHEKVLEICHRGHGIREVASATRLLKSLGFKVCYHMMPNLPGSNPSRDLVDFKKLFSDPRFQPDMLKIYPCAVLPGTVLEKWYKEGKHTPYSKEQLIKLLVEIKKVVPPYVRINRLIRDIPEFEITAGNKETNLRQVVKKKLEEQGFLCQCIRCREVRYHQPSSPLILKTIQYKSLAGREIFLQFVDSKGSLYGLLRLLLGDLAMVRELHVFGQELEFGGSVGRAAQHKGLGEKLLKKAEQLSKKSDYKKLSIISGVGVRGYYRKLGYNLKGTYMVKDI